MKVQLSCFLIILFTAGIAAQNSKDHAKVENYQVDSFLVNRPDGSLFNREVKKAETEKIARLYRFKNARIKAELAFKTKNQSFTV
ncbi:MAG: hypothetical protein KJO16_08955 [Muriicola sp.]|nr:hypothetical protein [Muriicola sp.]NNK10121.1 hypothetical protein [Flavobacteriaceae bacterium]